MTFKFQEEAHQRSTKPFELLYQKIYHDLYLQWMNERTSTTIWFSCVREHQPFSVTPCVRGIITLTSNFSSPALWSGSTWKPCLKSIVYPFSLPTLVSGLHVNMWMLLSHIRTECRITVRFYCWSIWPVLTCAWMTHTITDVLLSVLRWKKKHWQ